MPFTLLQDSLSDPIPAHFYLCLQQRGTLLKFPHKKEHWTNIIELGWKHYVPIIAGLAKDSAASGFSRPSTISPLFGIRYNVKLCQTGGDMMQLLDLETSSGSKSTEAQQKS